MASIADACKLYEQLAELPVPVSAQFIRPDVIQITSTIRDHVQKSKKSSTRTLFVTPSSVTSSAVALDSADIVKSIISPSGNRRALLREINTAGNRTRYVEIWEGERLHTSFEVSKLHGPFNNDEYLSSLSFSPSENALVYTAESNAPKDEDPNFAKYRFAPQFGEGVSGKKRPTLFVFRCGSQETTVVPLIFPSPSMYGQATWFTDSIIYATKYSYTAEGRILGVKGCYNRPTTIWKITLPKDLSTHCVAERVSSPELASRSPKLTGETLYWLANTVGGAHAKCVSLHSMDLKSGKETTLLEVVKDPRQRSDGFPGLYPSTSLPAETFIKLEGKTHIVTHSTFGSHNAVVLASAAGVEVLTASKGDQTYDWTVLTTDGVNQLLCARSAPAIPHEVVLGTVKSEARAISVDWRVIHKPTLPVALEQALSTLETSVIPIPERYPTETVVVRVRDAPKSSLCVTSPHGGPHATTLTSFTPSTAALALQGYTISSPNYTGSLGFGQEFVDKLLGQCGTLDVEDCIATTRHLITLGLSEKGSGSQAVSGGSHGGFLTGHLIGQYPEMFSAAVLRNPVVTAEVGVSDIEEWYYEEFGLPYFNGSPAPLMTPDVFKKLYEASPLAHIDKVKTPTLLLLGVVDQRVAPTQGISYYHALKGRGVDVDMLMFEGESHPLDGVEASRVGWEAGFRWLEKARQV